MSISNREKHIIEYAKACKYLPTDLVPNSEFIQLILKLSNQLENLEATCRGCKYFEHRYPETGMGYARGKCHQLSLNDKDMAYITKAYALIDNKVMPAEIMVRSDFVCELFSKK